MNKLKQFAFSSLFLLCILSVASCSADDNVIDDIQGMKDASKPNSCELILNVSKSGFDDEPQSRSAAGWENGDKIYLVFAAETGESYGSAQYNDGTWKVNYYGSLIEGIATTCTAVYFENPEFESSSVVKITANTGIYEDTNGQYLFNDRTLSVTVNLKPKTGRIRFAGTDNDEITVYGISHYTSFDCSKGKFTNTIGSMKMKVASGYTPYIYGEFSDAEQPRLNIITSDCAYTRLLAASIFQKGESGYITIPTLDSHNGWQNSAIFKFGGVEFKMIFVSYSSGNFLLAETETTENLYHAIMGGSVNNSQKPKTVTYSYWSSFIVTLKNKSSLSFRSPTYAEWCYAASGGNKSQGYTYSGSNIISEVAWYSGNSGGTLHPVKQLQPNELGFYDMSGNIDEHIGYDSGASYNWCGGYYSVSASSCTSSYVENSHSGHSGGLRIALSI